MHHVFTVHHILAGVWYMRRAIPLLAPRLPVPYH